MEQHSISKSFQGSMITVQVNFANDESLVLHYLEGREGSMLLNALQLDQGAGIDLDTDETPAYNYRLNIDPGLEKRLLGMVFRI